LGNWAEAPEAGRDRVVKIVLGGFMKVWGPYGGVGMWIRNCIRVGFTGM